jgi:GST-like protein
VLDRHLSANAYLAGDDYSIADIATWPWYGLLALGKVYGAAEFLQVEQYTHVRRWADAIAARPAVRRGRIVNRSFGEPHEQLAERHEAADIDAVLNKAP